MSSIVTAVFKATIGLLVNKGRDKAAEKLKDGDVTDQRFRGLIVREIDDIKTKLDGLARKDLIASISYFKEGIELLYEVFKKARLARREYGDVTAGTATGEAVALAQGMRKLELTGLDESTCRALVNAKGRFEDARRKATEAFANEALKLSDRVLAMQYRVMATILATVDNPEDAIVTCRVCIEELHSLSAVKEYFSVELKKGYLALISKEERRALISSVCHVNRVVYDVTLMVARRGEELMMPCIETGEKMVYPLRDTRVSKVLRKVGMEHCCITPWSFGQEGEEGHKLEKPRGIYTNKDGQFVIADDADNTVKVFDSSGHFILRISPNADNDETELVNVHDVAADEEGNMYIYGLVWLKETGSKREETRLTTDEEGNIYALVTPSETGSKREETRWTAHVLVFNSAGKQLRKFPVKWSGYWGRLTVSRNKVLVAWCRGVAVYELDGGCVRSIGEKELKDAADITAGPDGRVLVLDRGDHCIHVFTEDGQQLKKFSVQTEEAHYYRVACHPGGEHVILAGYERGTCYLCVAVYTKDGECQRIVKLDQRLERIGGIAVSMEGHICVTDYLAGKVIVL